MDKFVNSTKFTLTVKKQLSAGCLSVMCLGQLSLLPSAGTMFTLVPDDSIIGNLSRLRD